MRDDSGNLGSSLEKAWKDLKRFDMEEIAEKSGAETDCEGLVLEFLGTHYRIYLENEEVKTRDGKATNPFFEAIILHYLVESKDFPVSGKHISFREIYGGDIYFGAFYNRTIAPIIERFGMDPEGLVKGGEKMGGTVVEKGDAAVKIPVFPKVYYLFVVWKGDDEVAPSANVLFDSTIGYNLPTEDISALGSMIAGQLIRNAE